MSDDGRLLVLLRYLRWLVCFADFFKDGIA